MHILLDIPAHGIHTELTGTVTPAAPTLTAPTSRMQDSDIASLVQLRQTVESVVQFVQGFRHAERLLNLLDMQKRQTPCKASAVF